MWLQVLLFNTNYAAQLAGTVEHADCISAEE